MSRLPVLKPRQVEQILHALGFQAVRQRGTTVPFHGARDISPFLLRQIIKDIGLTDEEFLQHRR